MKMRKIILFATIIMLIATSCNKKRSSYVPDNYEYSSTTSDEKDTSFLNEPEEENYGFKVTFKQRDDGLKTVHVKFNDIAGFDAVFDTGCSGMMISLQEAMSLHKAGTLTDNDFLGQQQSSIANGEIIENAVFMIREVSLTDTEGNKHSIHDVQATVIENPEAPILVGNSVIDQFAKYAYTIDLQKNEIIFQ